MPVVSKPAAKATKAPAAVASMNPDNMVQGGLKDDFDGLITKSRLVPWDYDGNIDHDILAVALTIQVDGEDEPFVQHYSAGELESFVPSMDGENPVDMSGEDKSEMEGIYALGVGSKTGLNNNTNWAHFIGALIAAGFDKAAITADVRFCEGVYGHFNRVAQKKRSGIVNQNEQQNTKKRNNDILVVTEIKEIRDLSETKPAKKGAAAAKSAPAKPAPAAKSAPAEEAESLEDRVRAVVGEAVKAAGEEGLAKNKLSALVMKAFNGGDKAKALKLVGSADFLGADENTWAFDPEEGTLIHIEQ